MTLKELVKAAHSNAKAHGWWDGDSHNIPEKLALVHSEISEALEEIRNGIPPTKTYYRRDVSSTGAISYCEKPEGFGVELADAVIRIADLCGYLGIDLEETVHLKHSFNLTRPYKHGKVL